MIKVCCESECSGLSLGTEVTREDGNKILLTFECNPRVQVSYQYSIRVGVLMSTCVSTHQCVQEMFTSVKCNCFHKGQASCNSFFFPRSFNFAANVFYSALSACNQHAEPV